MVIKPEPVARRWLSWLADGLQCPTEQNQNHQKGDIQKSSLLWAHNQIHFSFIAQPPRNTLDWTHHGVDMEPRRKSIP